MAKGDPMNYERLSIMIIALCFIIAMVLVVIGMVQTARADTARSAFDGKWTINFTDCNGKTTIYKDCKVNNINDTFVTFTTAGRSREMKLPLTSICAMVIMERER